MVSPFAVFKIVKIIGQHGPASARPVVAYLMKRKAVQLATQPLLEGVAIALFDTTRTTGPDPAGRQFEKSPQVLLAQREPRTGRGFLELFPTTGDAAAVYTKAIQLRRNTPDVTLMTDLNMVGFVIGQVGLTPMMPLIGRELRERVALDLGVPKWVVVTANIAGSIFTI